MPPPVDPDTARRLAMVVATAEYTDPTLQQLRAPGRDADDLAEVLRDPTIGSFDVRTLFNPRSDDVLREIAEFCTDRSPSDLLLLYLSCHGVLDDRGRLYYATTNTERRLLSATAVSAQWLNDQLDDCRARRQILILDCCHSGAFAKGAKGSGALALEDRFSGRGRVVLTASRATEYSFEGNRVLGDGISSVFTAAVVEGLRSGDADGDNDGKITVAELYDYVYSEVKAVEGRQTPALWAYGAEGKLLLARSPRGPVVEPLALPESLQVVLDNPRPAVRVAGVKELADMLAGPQPGLALTARRTLEDIADQDVPQVAAAARLVLATLPEQKTESQSRSVNTEPRSLPGVNNRAGRDPTAGTDAVSTGTNLEHLPASRASERAGLAPPTESTSLPDRVGEPGQLDGSAPVASGPAQQRIDRARDGQSRPQRRTWRRASVAANEGPSSVAMMALVGVSIVLGLGMVNIGWEDPQRYAGSLLIAICGTAEVLSAVLASRHNVPLSSTLLSYVHGVMSLWLSLYFGVLAQVIGGGLPVVVFWTGWSLLVTGLAVTSAASHALFRKAQPGRYLAGALTIGLGMTTAGIGALNFSFFYLRAGAWVTLVGAGVVFLGWIVRRRPHFFSASAKTT